MKYGVICLFLCLFHGILTVNYESITLMYEGIKLMYEDLFWQALSEEIETSYFHVSNQFHFHQYMIWKLKQLLELEIYISRDQYLKFHDHWIESEKESTLYLHSLHNI